MSDKVIAVVSGGPDSFCSLVYWVSRGYNAIVLFFNYGQKAVSSELRALDELIGELRKISRERGWGTVDGPLIVDTSFMKSLWSGTQLVDEEVKVKEEYERTVVVPIRNVLMSVIATAYAYTLLENGECDRVVVVLGSQYDDVKPRDDTWEPRYPDCSPECYIALETALRICHFRDIREKIVLWSPSKAMLKKAELLRACYELVGDLVYKTWSCYQGLERHCGVCESCRNRKRAFREAGIPDKTEYRVP